MEEKGAAAEQILEQEQIKEDESNIEQDNVRNVENKEEKADGIEVEKQQIPKETKAEKNKSKGKKAIDDNKQSQAQKARVNQADVPKKPIQAPKQIPKMKTTVPQPFSLATDKRMSRERRASVDLSSRTEKKVVKERRASVDFNDLQLPKLSKSASVNYKAQSSHNGKDLVASKLTRSATTASISRPRVTSTRSDDKKVKNGVKSREKTQVKFIQNNSSQSIPKKNQAEESENNKLQKSSTFRTLPLPSFNRRREPPSKSELKKIPTTGPKSAPPGREGQKSTSDAEKDKTKNIGNKIVSRTISSSAKETISKLIKGTRRALNPSKETVKSAVSTA